MFKVGQKQSFIYILKGRSLVLYHYYVFLIDNKNPAGIYLFKVNNGNIGIMSEICSKLTIKTYERRQWRRSGVFIDKFEQILRLVLEFILPILSR